MTTEALELRPLLNQGMVLNGAHSLAESEVLCPLSVKVGAEGFVGRLQVVGKPRKSFPVTWAKDTPLIKATLKKRAEQGVSIALTTYRNSLC